MTHAKLTEIVHADFFDYTAIEPSLRDADACFFCLGVSSVGMKEDDYRHITYDLTMAAAKTLHRLNPNLAFIYVSGAGTDSTEKGRSMWARVKGKTENDLAKLFARAYMFRPGYIHPGEGRPLEDRLGQRGRSRCCGRSGSCSSSSRASAPAPTCSGAR